jgi:hypothetical protein
MVAVVGVVVQLVWQAATDPQQKPKPQQLDTL